MSEKNYTIETFETKRDWLSKRGLGGSSASAIVGKNPWMTKLELFKAISFPTERAERTSDAMTYGTLSEPLIRKQFELDWQGIYEVTEPNGFEMYRRKDKTYLTATVDGLLKEVKTGRKGIHEIKTHDIRGRADLEEWVGKIPDNYFIQCLHYLAVIQDADFVVLTAKLRHFDWSADESRRLVKSETVNYYIERSEVQNQIDWLEAKETDFWENNVVKKALPNITIEF